MNDNKKAAMKKFRESNVLFQVYLDKKEYEDFQSFARSKSVDSQAYIKRHIREAISQARKQLDK